MFSGAARRLRQSVSQAATTTTTTAKAAGDAAVKGVVGGVTGAVSAIQRGVDSKNVAVPAVALAAVGVAGLVEWPAVLAVGGGALLLREMNRRRGTTTPNAAPAKSSGSRPSAQRKTRSVTPAKKSPRKASR